MYNRLKKLLENDLLNYINSSPRVLSGYSRKQLKTARRLKLSGPLPNGVPTNRKRNNSRLKKHIKKLKMLSNPSLSRTSIAIINKKYRKLLKKSQVD